VKEFPRPSIIVGTTNFDEFLADPTGSRRFWVVPVRVPFIPLDELAAERDRIWAAAVHAFHAGESWILPPELRQQAVEENAEFQMSDPWEEPVFAYCDEREKVTASEILSNVLNMDIDRQDRASQMRVTNLLKAGGWATRREVVHGKRKRFWFNPKFLDKGCPSCPEKDENQTAVEGQPSGQPPGQPSGQPPDLPPQSLTKSEEGEFVDNLTNLDNQIPKSTRNLQNSLCTDEPPSNALDGKSCEQSSSINGKSCEQSSSINGMITTTLEPPPLAIGDRVEILQSGQFYGKHVLIEAIADGVAVVRGDEWVVTQRYQLEELRRLKRKGGQNNG
jgi:predicted P-loop ATPase